MYRGDKFEIIFHKYKCSFFYGKIKIESERVFKTKNYHIVYD